MFTYRFFTALSAFLVIALGAFPPQPDNITVVRSAKFPAVSTSFKEVVSS